VNIVANKVRQTWKSAQLYIGFHVDPQGKKRQIPKVWPPKNANATIHNDPTEQEAFVVVKNVTGDAARDVQIKLHPEQIVLRRGSDDAWKGILVTEHSVTVAVAGISIKIDYNGTITREDGSDTTWIEANGSVLKETEFVVATMSGDGVDLARRTSDSIAVISETGVLSKAR